MRTPVIARFIDVFKTRRALLGCGLAALGLVVSVDERREVVAGKLTNRQRRKQRGRRRRRRRRGGGGSGAPPPPCFVCEDLDDSPNCRFTSIQAAINSSGGTITVCPGTYKETLRIDLNNEVGEPLRIIGRLAGQTTIDASGDGSAITVARFSAVTISDFLITDGKATAGGGIVNQGDLTLEDCEVTKNESEGAPGGGGIYNDGGRLTLTGTSVFDNEADDGQGGGIFNGSGGTVSLQPGSTVFGNEPNNCVGTSACGA